MPLDRYVPCPCGSGKKVKFCCPELLEQMDHIHRMLEGEQRLACLEYVRKTRANHPDKACLLAVQALLESELEQLDALRATLDHFAEKHPGNPVMLAETALYRGETQGALAAVEPLQRAIEASGEELPARVFVAIGSVARMLLSEGLVFPARAHLLLSAAISGGQDTTSMRLLTRLNRAADVSILLKEDHAPQDAPPGFTAAAEFEQALVLSHRGAWLAAAEHFEALAKSHENVAALWYNTGLCRAFVADFRAGVDALRRYATLDVPWDDAVEAEALAQLLDNRQIGDLADVVAAAYPLDDVADAQARLAADRRFWRLPVDLASMAEPDQPPPLSALRVLDRPLPASGEGLSREDIPHIVGEVFLFGKQTDRAARLELIATRGPQMEAAHRALTEALGQALGQPEVEEVVRRVPLFHESLNWRWQLPPEMSADQRIALGRARHRHTILEEWPSLFNPALLDKTPREASQDASLRIPLAAAVLNLELAAGDANGGELFTTLRTQLALPQPEDIDPAAAGSVEELSTARLARLKVEALSDDDLLTAYQRAGWLRFSPALSRLALEVVRRESLEGRVDKAEAYGMLAQIATDKAQQIEYIGLARKTAEAAGSSSAPWDLAELAVAAEHADQARFERLLTHLRTHHMREPGVPEALYGILQNLGMVGPAGPASGPEPSAAPSLIIPGQEAAASGQIWTPESAAPSGKQKSAIWTPGS